MEQTSKQTIKISEVIALLEDGKTRDDIAEHYAISKSDVKKLFAHPKLKHKKTKKAPNFIIEDDLEKIVAETVEAPEENVEEAAIEEVTETIEASEEPLLTSPEPVIEESAHNTSESSGIAWEN